MICLRLWFWKSLLLCCLALADEKCINSARSSGTSFSDLGGAIAYCCNRSASEVFVHVEGSVPTLSIEICPSVRHLSIIGTPGSTLVLQSNYLFALNSRNMSVDLVNISVISTSCSSFFAPNTRLSSFTMDSVLVSGLYGSFDRTVVTILSSIFQGYFNQCSSGSAVLSLSESSLHMSQTTVQGLVLSFPFVFCNFSTAVFSKSTFFNNSLDGNRIFLQVSLDPPSETIAILFASGSKLTIGDCTFVQNNADSMSLSHSSLNISSSTFVNCSATVFSMVTLLKGCNIIMEDVMCTNNTGWIGTCLLGLENNTVVALDSTFESNKLHPLSAAQEVLQNQASAGICLNSYGTLEVVRCIFRKNMAPLGSAITSGANVVTRILDSEFSNNEGSSVGAAIAVTLTADIKIRRSTFMNNVAKVSGGAIYVSINVTLQCDECLFFNNQVSSSSGISQGGGAVFVGTQSTFVSHHSTFQYCSSALDGGAVFVSAGGTLSLVNSHMYNCNALRGGCVRCSESSSCRMMFSTLSRCRSQEDGGAISFGAGVDGSISDSVISLSQALSGGAMSANPYTAIKICNSSISLNSAQIGGALYVQNANVSIVSSNISGNVAFQRGGGLEVASGFVILASVVALRNSANMGGFLSVRCMLLCF